MRTNVVEVKRIISTDLDVVQFALSASRLVDAKIAEGLLDESTLKEIETYLTAHLITITAPREESEKAGSVSAKYRGKTDMGIRSSLYGQHVLLLDSTNSFASADNDAKTATVLKHVSMYASTGNNIHDNLTKG